MNVTKLNCPFCSLLLLCLLVGCGGPELPPQGFRVVLSFAEGTHAVILPDSLMGEIRLDDPDQVWNPFNHPGNRIQGRLLYTFAWEFDTLFSRDLEMDLRGYVSEQGITGVKIQVRDPLRPGELIESIRDTIDHNEHLVTQFVTLKAKTCNIYSFLVCQSEVLFYDSLGRRVDADYSFGPGREPKVLRYENLVSTTDFRYAFPMAFRAGSKYMEDWVESDWIRWWRDFEGLSAQRRALYENFDSLQVTLQGAGDPALLMKRHQIALVYLEDELIRNPPDGVVELDSVRLLDGRLKIRSPKVEEIAIHPDSMIWMVQLGDPDGLVR